MSPPRLARAALSIQDSDVNALRDLLDAEWLLSLQRSGVRDGDASDDALAERGRAWLAQRDGSTATAREELGRSRDARRSLAMAWLDHERARAEQAPGAWMLRAHRILATSLALVGGVLGVSACAAALAGPAGEPVNLWRVLGLLVLLQLLLVLVLGAAMLWARARGGGSEAMTGFQRLLQAVQRWWWARRLSADWPSSPPALGAVERWTWFRLAQVLGIGFNLGAIAAFLALVLFSDLGFGWSTTPAELPFDLHALTQALAAPWSWVLPEYAPTPELIRATQWDALAGAFREAGETSDAVADPREAARAWWPFLLLSVVTWGLVPRVLLWAWAGWRRRRAVRRWPWNHEGWWEVFDVMLPPSTDWSSPHHDSDDGERASPRHGATTAAPPPGVDGASTPGRLVLWGAMPDDDAAWSSPAAREEGLDRAPRLRAGGPDATADERVARDAGDGATGAVWVVVEAGETPDKRVLRFLQALRAATGSEVPIVIGLAEPGDGGGWGAVRPRDRDIWQRTLTRLGDRHLRVRVLGPSAPREEVRDA